MKRKPSNRKDRHGVPIDKHAWTVEDWAALWRAMERARREIARMHRSEESLTIRLNATIRERTEE